MGPILQAVGSPAQLEGSRLERNCRREVKICILDPPKNAKDDVAILKIHGLGNKEGTKRSMEADRRQDEKRQFMEREKNLNSGNTYCTLKNLLIFLI